MKNRYNLEQVADIYCKEIGVDIPYMYEYLMDVFNGNPLEKYDKLFADIETPSEFFPEFKQIKYEKNLF